ncbi:MAG: FAD-dependent oxidoreductase [Ignavibacteriae bacterium]|nr:FAD-dependent oxidoreductase [Ignavibacteriota bacterium]NOG99219.1 FAD-dependent oxidoreductase [Ignavibacteriota bacterium]
MSFLENEIQKRLGGYKHLFNQVDESYPSKLKERKSAAIIGGGIAGLTSAIYLAERGFDVFIFEKNNYLGGKLGSWQVKFNDGYETNVEHGFHAFFRQYYNLKNLLKKIDADKYLIPIDDYLILTKKHGNFSFKDIDKTPVKNILSMRKKGIYSFSDAMFKMKGLELLSLLKFDDTKTFKDYDNISFEQYAEETKLPPEMKLMFTTFSRAFFAEPQYISMAELIKSFHFYFLSNDHGLIYDVLNDDFEFTFLDPCRKFIEERGGQIFLESPVTAIEQINGKFNVQGKIVDYVIVASDIPGTKRAVQYSPFIRSSYPEFMKQIQEMKESQRYAVLRIWTDKKLKGDYPFFIFTDALEILDSITIYHQMEKSSEQWVNENGGGIYELHSYALPDDFEEEKVREQLLKEFGEYFPEIKEAEIIYEYLQVKNDFTAFHTGLNKTRPGFKTEIENFYLAGDWVKLPVPAMLMEAAATSAMFAVNDIFEKEGLRQEMIWTVPVKGLLA